MQQFDLYGTIFCPNRLWKWFLERTNSTDSWRWLFLVLTFGVIFCELQSTSSFLLKKKGYLVDVFFYPIRKRSKDAILLFSHFSTHWSGIVADVNNLISFFLSFFLLREIVSRRLKSIEMRYRFPSSFTTNYVSMIRSDFSLGLLYIVIKSQNIPISRYSDISNRKW